MPQLRVADDAGYGASGGAAVIDRITELLAVAASLAIIAVLFAWLALLPSLGFLWLVGWLS